MEINCPYCGSELRVKRLGARTKATRYTPTCKDCDQQFVVIVPKLEIVIRKLEDGADTPQPVSATAADANATEIAALESSPDVSTDDDLFNLEIPRDDVDDDDSDLAALLGEDSDDDLFDFPGDDTKVAASSDSGIMSSVSRDGSRSAPEPADEPEFEMATETPAPSQRQNTAHNAAAREEGESRQPQPSAAGNNIEGTMAPGDAQPSPPDQKAHRRDVAPTPSKDIQGTMTAGDTRPSPASHHASRETGTESEAAAASGSKVSEHEQTMGTAVDPPEDATGISGVQGVADRSPNHQQTMDSAPNPNAVQTMDGTANAARDATQQGLAVSEHAADDTAFDEQLQAPPRLGGYQLLKELGRGGMGAVYLAKQLSLDRQVAIKLIQAKYARDPVYLSRFTREAYAAAQLNHHNVVQVYDLGAQSDIHFFSMEFVQGQSLADLLNERRKLAPMEAAGYILQAARGLHFAHQHGLIHRDIKPANLMINSQGIVKVADLGLVKHLGDRDDRDADDGATGESFQQAFDANVTSPQVAMGTPAYMAPEQAGDAAKVDHRADIYALGCTFYALLTGKPPFEGTTAMEVISKHKSEPVSPPEKVVPGIPLGMSQATLGMMNKEPSLRPHSLEDVISNLESMVSGRSNKDVSIARQVEQFAEVYNTAGLRPSLSKLMWAAVGLWVIAIAATMSFFGWKIAFAVLLAGVTAVVANVLIYGFANGTHLIYKTRELVFSSRWIDYLAVLGGVFVGGALTWLLGLSVHAGVAIVVGICLALIFYQFVQRPILASQHYALAKIEDTVRTLRLSGRDESSIHLLISRACGKDWEDLFERLFGHDARILIKEQRAASESSGQPKAFSWNDWLVDQAQTRIQELQRQREASYLQKVERERLQAEGATPAEAREQAEDTAELLVEQARMLYEARNQSAGDKRKMVKDMLAGNRDGAQRKRKTVRERCEDMITFTLGGYTRFACAIAMLMLFAFWVDHNGIFTESDAASLSASSGLSELADAGEEASAKLFSRNLTPADLKPLPFLPGEFGQLCNGFRLAFAAGLLLLSALWFRGAKAPFVSFGVVAIVLLVPYALEPLQIDYGLPDFGMIRSTELLGLGVGSLLILLFGQYGTE